MKVPANLLRAAGALALLASTCGVLSGCAELNDPYYGNSYDRDRGYHNDDYYRHRDDYDRHEYYEERERERDREREREREEERRREAERYSQPPPSRAEHCPPGFSPSEQKCSQAERRHGCKDMRLPGGLGCVHR